MLNEVFVVAGRNKKGYQGNRALFLPDDWKDLVYTYHKVVCSSTSRTRGNEAQRSKQNLKALFKEKVELFLI